MHYYVFHNLKEALKYSMLKVEKKCRQLSCQWKKRLKCLASREFPIDYLWFKLEGFKKNGIEGAIYSSLTVVFISSNY